MSNLTYDYATEIGLQYGELNPVAEWCEKNCKGEWTIKFNATPVSNGNLYTFLFDSEEDYINFLIWKK